jgi:hypothetical protein
VVTEWSHRGSRWVRSRCLASVPQPLRFAALAERYLREHAEVRKKSRSVNEDRRLLETLILPQLKGERVAAITRRDVAGLHYSLVDTPAQEELGAILEKVEKLNRQTKELLAKEPVAGGRTPEENGDELGQLKEGGEREDQAG